VIRTAAAAVVLLLVLALTLPVASAQITMGSPSWSQLTPQERQVLAPLASEWENLDAQRKQKWRGIAERYPWMGSSELHRIHQQM
jgi:hypothetical protein